MFPCILLYMYRLKGEEKDDVYDFGVILLEMLVGRAINSVNDVNVSKDIVSREHEHEFCSTLNAKC